MVYPNYYARRLTAQGGWHRPGYPQAGGWRQGYGARPGNPGARNYAGRYQPRYGVGGQSRWHWMRNIGQGFRGQGLRRGRYWPQSSGYAGGAQSYAPQDSGGPAPQAQSLGPQWVSWAQSCLAQAVGTWVPQNGIMGKATRHAISKFQKQQQLPGTGMLDAATISALQAACSGQAAAAPGPGAPPLPPPAPAAPSAPAGDDVAAATAAASGSGAPPPDAAPPDAGAAPPDAASGELYLGRTRRHRRRWGSGFNFQQPPPQPPDSDDDSEFFMGGGRDRFRRGSGGGMGYQQPDEGGDGNSNRWQRRRW